MAVRNSPTVRVRWATDGILQPVLSACRYERHGRALGYGRSSELNLREIIYVDRTRVQWRYLPHDFPLWNSVATPCAAAGWAYGA